MSAKPQAGEPIHVFPVNDLREHITAGWPKLTCWCNPEIDTEDGILIVHNAADQRERYERGELKPH